MKQLLQYPREKTPHEVVLPDPVVQPGMVMIDNRASLISAGTERASVQLTRASLVEKARRRPDLVKRVLDKARTQGIAQTWRQAKHRLDTPLAPGYSCSGVVTGVGDGATEYKIGDRVAAAGQNLASHAETVNVPVNLVCPLPDPVEFAEGAFVAVGAVALHGVRTAEPAIGETVAVIGLGLLGLLTARILNAHGCHVIGIDPVTERRALLPRTNATLGVAPDTAVNSVMQATGGRGADRVIICAASASTDILDTAAQLARGRAIVVCVGAVPLVAPRDLFYAKELQLRVSRSYGPGRYDSAYEERGMQYPLEYIRWTENQNMRAFLDLIADRRIEIRPLITHRFELDHAPEAYETIESDSSAIAVVFEYPEKTERTPILRHLASRKAPRKKGTLGIGFWGAGQFAGGVLAPIFASHRYAHMQSVVAQTPASAARAMHQHGFTTSSCRAEDLLIDPDVDIIVIATPHSLHAGQAQAALRAGKTVFLEKPMAIDRDQLRDLVAAVSSEGGRVQVGFNRRYSPAAREIRQMLEPLTGPKTVIYRVAAGPAPVKGWLSDPREGGRLIGEVAHFVDTIQYLVGSWPTRVWAERLGGADADGVMLTVTFMDGSVGTIVYSSESHPSTAKEHVEVLAGGLTATIDDYKRWTIRSGNRQLKKSTRQDKGHRAQIDALLGSVRLDGLAAGNFAAAVYATEVTFAAGESLRTGQPVQVQPWL